MDWTVLFTRGISGWSKGPEFHPCQSDLEIIGWLSMVIQLTLTQSDSVQALW